MLILFFIVSVFINIESGGKNINGDGGQSIGIMQIRQQTAKFILNKHKIKEPVNIRQELSKTDYNKKIGILLLNYLLYKNNSFVSFVNSYNTGNFTKLKHNENYVYYQRFLKSCGFFKVLSLNIIFTLNKNIISLIMFFEYFF